ncbi:hypothetical protein R6Q59_027142 [Mikania micrantha]
MVRPIKISYTFEGVKRRFSNFEQLPNNLRSSIADSKSSLNYVLLIRWHAVASWTWDAHDETCGICRMAFDGCCTDCKLPGDDCPLICWSSDSRVKFFHENEIRGLEKMDMMVRSEEKKKRKQRALIGLKECRLDNRITFDRPTTARRPPLTIDRPSSPPVSTTALHHHRRPTTAHLPSPPLADHLSSPGLHHRGASSPGLHHRGAPPPALHLRRRTSHRSVMMFGPPLLQKRFADVVRRLKSMGRLQSRLPSSLHSEMGEFADLSGSLPHVPSRMAV